ncbi:MAG: gamma carbonic anhydrase family protein [Candidatus Carbobacillus sp.]|nr:gamma carbonic anhydrase family protein [Candidatus Carbobacillus sp.]
MPVIPYLSSTPQIADHVFIAEDAWISGNVRIGMHTNIWFGVVIRGDVAPTTIGTRVSIQDLTVIHQSPDHPVVIDDDVVIGHRALIHGATIHRGALIGMGAIILDGAVIGEGALIGAGSLVPPGMVVPPRKVALGHPARITRDVLEKDILEHRRIVETYVMRGKTYHDIFQTMHKNT